MDPGDVVEIARAAAIGPPDALLAALRRLADPVRTAAGMRYHVLVSLVLETAAAWGVRADLPPDLVVALESGRPLRLLDAATALDGFAEVERTLQSAGVGSLLLKGPVLGHRLYGDTRRRPQFNLDILVRSRDFARAATALRKCGFLRHSYDGHSSTWVRAGLKVDLHGWLRRAPIYRIDEARLWHTAGVVGVADRAVRTLSDEYLLLLLALSLFEDLGQGTTRLRHLLDAWLLLRDVDATLNWGAFFAARAVESTDTVVAHTFAVVLATFDDNAAAPRLRTAMSSLPIETAASTARARALVFAPRKHPANLSWFREVYPGSMLAYLLAFWWGSFPGNLRDLDRQRFAAAAGALRRRASRTRASLTIV